MPLLSGYSRETVARNIEEMIRGGREQSQAVAAAMSAARRSFFARHRDDKLPTWLQFPKGYALREYYEPSGAPLFAAKKVIRQNPSPRGEVRQAEKLFKDFSGHEITWAKRVPVRAPKTGLAIGPVLGIMYLAVRDGKAEKYLHQFRASSRPHLAISSDGKTALMLGGAWRFTDRGFVDE